MSKYLALSSLILLGLSLFELGTAFGLLGGHSVSSYFTPQRVVSLMNSLGYLSLFALMTLESASLPIPSEVVLPFAGYLVYLGVMNFAVALAISTVAALLGAFFDYYLALILGRVFVDRFLRRFGMDHRSLETAERWFSKRGSWTVLGARFVPVVRSVVSLPAGLLRMPLWSFALFTTLGCLAWNTVLISAGYTAGSLWEKVVGTSFSLLLDSLVAVVAAGSALYLVYYGYRQVRTRVDR